MTIEKSPGKTSAFIKVEKLSWNMGSDPTDGLDVVAVVRNAGVDSIIFDQNLGLVRSLGILGHSIPSSGKSSSVEPASVKMLAEARLVSDNGQLAPGAEAQFSGRLSFAHGLPNEFRCLLSLVESDDIWLPNGAGAFQVFDVQKNDASNFHSEIVDLEVLHAEQADDACGIIEMFIDREYYLSQFEGAVIDNLALHYAQTGCLNYGNPTRTFNTFIHYSKFPYLMSSGLNPFAHFIENGGLPAADQQLVASVLARQRMRRQRTLLTNAIFDLDYIADRIGHRFISGRAALAAYCAMPDGMRFNPSVFFNRGYYLHKHADVRYRGVDPLLHYLDQGYQEGRDTHPLIDCDFLRETGALESTSSVDILIAFAAGQIDKSPHRFLDLDFLRAQLGQGLSAREIFKRLADDTISLSLQPHPLFSTEFYNLNGSRNVPNELFDYIMFNPGAEYIHPLFSPQYYMANRSEDPTIPSLFIYLKNWANYDSDPSLLVDLKFLNHTLSRMGVDNEKDPLSTALLLNKDFESTTLHPHFDHRVIQFSFSNLLLNSSEAAIHQQWVVALTRLLLCRIHTPAQEGGRPEVSVIILNYKKPVYTLLSIFAACNSLREFRYEIVVVDNGGDSFHFEEMSRVLKSFPQVIFHKTEKNKFFGEGNNIGADLSRGDNIIFLNNDCFLREDFGEQLRRILDNRRDIDVVGATLQFPNGTLQEFGGYISDCGQVIQRAKNMNESMIVSYSSVEQVDYSSAACLIMSRSALHAVAGFDPVFEPFYYEDTDLCRRLKVAGIPVYVSPLLRAMHIENASTREFLADGFNELIRHNRSIFARRWLKESGRGCFIPGRSAEATPPLPEPPLTRETAVVYTPFDIRAGGGERYLLSAARALSATHQVVIATDGKTSRARIQFVCHALGIEPFRFTTATLREVLAAPRRPDIAFVMGNEIVPPVPAFGRRNIFHLQFPFPWRNVGRYDFASVTAYDCLIVNSEYTKGWTLRRFAEVGVKVPPPVHVVFPPVRLIDLGTPKPTTGPLRLVTVGRFFTAGHSKRQDLFLEIVERLQDSGLHIEATLIGSVHNSPEAKAFFARIVERVSEMRGVRVLVDASRNEVEQGLLNSDVYIHCAGLGVREEVTPERAEHFGISVVEAMSAGCLPLVAGIGGPREIIAAAGVGECFSNVDEAVFLLRELAVSGRQLRLTETPIWLEQTSEAAFDQRVRSLVAGWTNHAASPSAPSKAPPYRSKSKVLASN